MQEASADSWMRSRLSGELEYRAPPSGQQGSRLYLERRICKSERSSILHLHPMHLHNRRTLLEQVYISARSISTISVTPNELGHQAVVPNSLAKVLDESVGSEAGADHTYDCRTPKVSLGRP